MKKILVAPDSFKGTLTSVEVTENIIRGMKRALPSAGFIPLPMSDGGEGLIKAIYYSLGGKMLTSRVTGPLGNQVDARYLLLKDTAIIEMARAAGLSLVPPEKLNPLRATTHGVGELILAASRKGARKVIVGLGGSATVDGGAGMAQALGIKLLNHKGKEIGRGGGELCKLKHIDISAPAPLLKKVKVTAACDVENPLLGKNGAARVFGPQKGVTPAQVSLLEEGLCKLSQVIKKDLHINVGKIKGGGAAGGLGAGLKAFAGAELKKGIELFMRMVGFDSLSKKSSVVITGEGRLDGQSVRGKTPVGVALRAKKLGLPVIAVIGCRGSGAEKCLSAGIDAFFDCISSSMSKEEISAHAAKNVRDTAEQIARMLFILGADS